MNSEFFTDSEMKLLSDICSQIINLLEKFPDEVLQELIILENWKVIDKKFKNGLKNNLFMINKKEISFVGLVLTILGINIYRYSDFDYNFVRSLNQKLYNIAENNINPNFN